MFRLAFAGRSDKGEKMNPEIIDIPSSSADLLLVLPEPQTSSTDSDEIEFTVEDYRTALRMLVGSALEGTDELRNRLKTWLVNIRKGEQEIGASILEKETGGSQLLYALIGLLFKTPEYLSRGTSAAGRASSRMIAFVSIFTTPITNSWVMRPVRRRYHDLAARRKYTLRSLEEIGRSEATFSRALVRQQVTDEAIVELLTYLVEKSKLREMIQDTTMDVGGDALVEMRERGASVDSSLDRLVDNILRRNKLQTPPTDSSS
jgi:hypothetical protein